MVTQSLGVALTAARAFAGGAGSVIAAMATTNLLLPAVYAGRIVWVPSRLARCAAAIHGRAQAGQGVWGGRWWGAAAGRLLTLSHEAQCFMNATVCIVFIRRDQAHLCISS